MDQAFNAYGVPHGVNWGNDTLAPSAQSALRAAYESELARRQHFGLPIEGGPTSTEGNIPPLIEPTPENMQRLGNATRNDQPAAPRVNANGTSYNGGGNNNQTNPGEAPRVNADGTPYTGSNTTTNPSGSGSYSPPGSIRDANGNIIGYNPGSGTPPPPTPDPTNPFHQTMPTNFNTWPDWAQALYLQAGTSLQTAITNGQVVNPNIINLTAADTQKLVDQSVTELDPYYQEQFAGEKNNFLTSIARLTGDYTKIAKREQDTFGQTLKDQSATEADNGLAFSSGRNNREVNTVTNENNALSDLYTNVQRSAQDLGNSYEGKVGSEGLRAVNLASLQGYSATNRGINLGTYSPLINPSGNIALGSIGSARATALRSRQNELESAFRQNRLLDLNSLA